MKKITLIAEIGENHLGKIELAKKMIVGFETESILKARGTPNLWKG